jgi:hypothetical protein
MLVVGCRSFGTAYLSLVQDANSEAGYTTSQKSKTSTTPRWKPEISPKEIISLNKIKGFEPVYLTTLSITKIIQRKRQINEELRNTGGMMLIG